MKEIRLLASYNWNVTFIVQAHGGEDAIKHHPFFRDVKWKELEERKVKPPFKPKFVSLCLAIYKHLLTFCLAEEPERGNKFWYRIYKRGPCSDPCQPRNYQNHPTGENNNWKGNWNQLFLISGRVWRVQFLKLSIWKAVNPASEEALRLFRADCFFQVSTAPMFWKVLRVLSWFWVCFGLQCSPCNDQPIFWPQKHNQYWAQISFYSNNLGRILQNMPFDFKWWYNFAQKLEHR